MLAMQIVRGQFPPLPSVFSYELRGLITSLMKQDPNLRPNINQIVKNKLIAPRIRNFLNNAEFQDEFAHTILHK